MTKTKTKKPQPVIVKEEGDPYQFDELSEDAKREAVSQYCDYNVEYDWWDCTYDDAKTIGLEIKGFDIGRGRDIQGDFTDYAEDCAKAIIKEHGECCKTFQTATSFLGELLVLQVKARLLEGTEDEDGDCMEDVILGEIEELEYTFRKDILNCYWTMLRDEYEYLCSDEAIIESITSNEYEFNEDGTRY